MSFLRGTAFLKEQDFFSGGEVRSDRKKGEKKKVLVGESREPEQPIAILVSHHLFLWKGVREGGGEVRGEELRAPGPRPRSIQHDDEPVAKKNPSQEKRR